MHSFIGPLHDPSHGKKSHMLGCKLLSGTYGFCLPTLQNVMMTDLTYLCDRVSFLRSHFEQQQTGITTDQRFAPFS